MDIGSKWAKGQRGVYQKFYCISVMKLIDLSYVKYSIAQEQPPMGPHHEKIIKRLIYPTLTFSALTTRLLCVTQST